MKPTIWKNCYSQQWAGILIPPAFAHPAKISLALVKKIFAHALEQGWIRKGDTCVDPFAGIGGVAFGAMANGINFIGQELEPHFVDLANGMDCTGISKADWVRFYGRWEKANRRDGRHWCPACLAQAKQIVNPIMKTKDLFDLLGTASYERNSGKIPSTLPHHFEGNLEFWKRKFGLSGAVIVQGDSRKLLENLRGRVECVVSSPPYAGNEKSDYHLSDDGKMRRRDEGRGYQQGRGCFRGSETYGQSAGQLGAMRDKDFDLVISSPPYADSIRGSGNGIDFSKIKNGGTNRTAAREAIGTGYGESPAQLAAMPEGCFDIAVSSPPFEACLGSGGKNHKGVIPPHDTTGFVFTDYKNSQGNIGTSTDETFWSAAREIVQQCFLALKPGGHSIWVCKNFVRNGKIVEFSRQWATLCESVGFKLVCWHYAILSRSGGVQLSIDGEDDEKVIWHKSFFRRLGEEKGAPPIDWEDILCFVKPAQTFERIFIEARNGAAKLKTETVEV